MTLPKNCFQPWLCRTWGYYYAGKNACKKKKGDAMTTEITTPEGALLWLAGLEITCGDCTVKDGVPCNCLACDGKVPVLDLREPCPWEEFHIKYDQGTKEPAYERRLCPSRRDPRDAPCTGWQARRGREALHQAMEKDGWYYLIFQEGTRMVRFWRWGRNHPALVIQIDGTDSNDWIAAMKAMQAVGYGKDNGYTT